MRGGGQLAQIDPPLQEKTFLVGLRICMCLFHYQCVLQYIPLLEYYNITLIVY